LSHLSLAYPNSKHFKQFIMCQNASAFVPHSLVVGNAPASLFSKIIEQRAYEEKPQGFEVYQEETFVCRWKKTTWWRTSNAQQKRGEKISMTEILYQNGYS
jgi:hypothetical protein